MYLHQRLVPPFISVAKLMASSSSGAVNTYITRKLLRSMVEPSTNICQASKTFDYSPESLIVVVGVAIFAIGALWVN